MNDVSVAKIWREFTKSDYPITDSSQINPLAFSILLDEIHDSEFRRTPEWHINEGRLCFMPRLRNEKHQICIRFKKDSGGNWKFHSTLPVNTRIDKIESIPTNCFPTLPIQELRWKRETFETEMRVDLFNTLKELKGSQFAIEWFADGDEFRELIIEMLPFLPCHKAFIYYKCWFHSQLLGETTNLLVFDENKAEIELERCKHLAIYEQNRKIKKQIDKRTYLALYETTWDDRAGKCGWNVKISYSDLSTHFLLTR